MLKGQKYPAGNSYAIPTDYSVVAPATRSARKSADAVSLISSTLGRTVTAPIDEGTYLLRSLTEKLHDLMWWTGEQLHQITQTTGITPHQEATLRAIYRLLMDAYEVKVDQLQSAGLPLQFVWHTYQVHAICCGEINTYLRKHKIKGLSVQPLILN